MSASRVSGVIALLRSSSPRGPREHVHGELLARALKLSVASVCASALIGTLAVAVGIAEGSVSVLGSGLGLLADLAGSVVLVWRFENERRHPVHAQRAERRAGTVVAIALALVAIVVAADALKALLDHKPPKGSWLSLVAVAVPLVALPPLALAKRRTATLLGSHALRGDSSITAIGAGTALIALVGLALFQVLGWWWADGVAALIVATVAASEAYEVSRGVRVGYLD